MLVSGPNHGGSMQRVAAIVLVALAQGAIGAQQDDGSGTFASAVAAYSEFHRRAAADLPIGGDPEAATILAATLADRIRAGRASAKPGDVFGPASSSFRALIRREVSGSQGRVMLTAIHESNVEGARVRVNHRYPPGLPRATMPGQLLAKLPALPPELEYRFL